MKDRDNGHNQLCSIPGHKIDVINLAFFLTRHGECTIDYYNDI